MNEKTKTGLEILQTAVLLGVLGDVLLRQMPLGLNALLFIGALVAALVMLVRRHRREFVSGSTTALNVALVFFAAMFVWRDSTELQVFDTLAIFAILAVISLPATNLKVGAAGLFHYLAGFIWSGMNAAFSPFLLLLDDIHWKSLPQTGWSKHLIAVLRGLLIATPILLVFGGLFVAADAVFQGIIERTFRIQPDVIVSHFVGIGFFTWITAGYLRAVLMQGFPVPVEKQTGEATIPEQVASVTEIADEEPKIVPPSSDPRGWREFDNSVMPSIFTLGAIEVSIILGLINLLFLSFVIVQVPYLFGGFQLVQNTPDFKLADYARRGFGELVAVAALVLPILLVSHWLLRKDSPVNEKIYRVLATIQIALLFVIMASAAQRLLILTGSLGYGLTTVRFYPMVAMIWMAVLFLIFAGTVLRGARNQFAWSALWSALVILGALHFFNPDAYIVRTNIALMKQGRMFDASYNARLSDDAVPTLLEHFAELDAIRQNDVFETLARRNCKKREETDVRSWNYSRWQAQNALKNSTITGYAGDCSKFSYRDRDFMD